MCCDGLRELFAQSVVDMVEHYEAQYAEREFDWGGEWDELASLLHRFLSRCDSDKWTTVFERWSSPGTVRDAMNVIRSCLPEPVPTGVAIIDESGITIGAPLPFVIPSNTLVYDVFNFRNRPDVEALRKVSVSHSYPFIMDDDRVFPAAVPRESGWLRLVADETSRWSVVDSRGGAWFPEPGLRKYDDEDRPFFYGNDVLLAVPSGDLKVTVARGCEFQAVSSFVDVVSDRETVVRLTPRRVYDAAARGWYGADLHVHMNYSGDQVCTLADAASMQKGERLHLMNLVAGNLRTSTVYDRAGFEAFIGSDLPWSSDDSVARFGIEYRNDLLGHFHTLNPQAPPTRYNTGHALSSEPYDWPPNATAARELLGVGGTVSYTHPVVVPIDRDGSLDGVFAIERARKPQARELVVDAALGLVDSVDLLGGPSNVDGTEYLYHRLLGCGLRLGATAGSDVLLSHSRALCFSNPPGWCRAYAYLGDEPLTVSAWQSAMRSCRTFVTNGPWLEISVDGLGPGAIHQLVGPETLTVVARAVGLGMDRLDIVGPDGVVASQKVPVDAEDVELQVDFHVTDPTWISASVRGGSRPTIVGSQPRIYAHTSPVWVEMDGSSIARSSDADWCIEWLDRFESLLRETGRFANEHQLNDLVLLIDKARDFYSNIGYGHDTSPTD